MSDVEAMDAHLDAIEAEIRDMSKKGHRRGSRVLKPGGRALTSGRPATPPPVTVRFVCPVCGGSHRRDEHQAAA